MFERGVGCIWIVRVICTAQRALSVLDVLVYILVFQGRTLTCHSLLLRLVLFIFSLATFCIHVYDFFSFPFLALFLLFLFSVWPDPTLTTCHSSGRLYASPLGDLKWSYGRGRVTGGEGGRPECQEQCKPPCTHMLSWQGLAQCC